MTNVLIVDDEKIEREGLKYLLSREEGERNVFEASNGKQALQIIRSEDIQLVLTDIKCLIWTGWNYQDVPRKKIRHCRS